MIPAFDFLLRFLIFAAIHSILATDAAKKWITSANIPLVSKWYRLTYNILSGILVLWIMAGWPNSNILYVIPGWWHLLFRAAQCMVLIVAVRCMLQTGLSEFLGFSDSDKSDLLVTTGCYGKVRHPLYFLGMVFMALEPAPSGKWLLFTLLATLYCLLAIRWEEQRLIERFGNLYREYQATVPAILPIKRKQ